MGHQKELLSGFSRCFERIFLLLFSFDNPFSHSPAFGAQARRDMLHITVGTYSRVYFILCIMQCICKVMLVERASIQHVPLAGIREERLNRVGTSLLATCHTQ